ncbi:MAG TPA: oxygen-independent coproporphyrinogen III oxidase [Permianibacter sp.]|nr:oxygen-independent coproporphyrinogen III oxidase [Permianibacter sp.]
MTMILNFPIQQAPTAINRDLIARYNLSGPRYTSYPTALQFRNDFTVQDYQKALASLNPETPLSLYLHMPFCATLCYYCACNKIVTKDRTKSSTYVEYLKREIALHAKNLGRKPKVKQMHWGGGTPTFLSHPEMAAVVKTLHQHFDFAPRDDGEYAIEIDPRSIQSDTLAFLGELGFNRVSLGVQDFDERVQRAVNRIQSYEQTEQAVLQSRAHGFRSLNIDLIYGLPFQTEESFRHTLEKVLTLQPDRLSIFNYAHLPTHFKPQQAIPTYALPSPEEKLRIMEYTVGFLTRSGYAHIGMDHFAKPDDELAVAQRNGQLQRNFQGYSTHAECELLSLGVSSISQIGDYYFQNVKDLEQYYAMLDEHKLPLWRGVKLDEDDRIRRAVIMQLICHFHLEFAKLEAQFGIIFRDYFKRELERLQEFVDDGLLLIHEEGMEVTPLGRLLIRNICTTFDRYLSDMAEGRYSRLI